MAKSKSKTPPRDRNAWPDKNGRNGPRAGDMMFTIRAPRALVDTFRKRAIARGADASTVLRTYMGLYK